MLLWTVEEDGKIGLRFVFFSFPTLRGKNLARAECLLIPTIGNLTFSFCFSPSLIFTQPKVGVRPSRMIQQSHPVVTKACLRVPGETEMSQAHLFPKVMKSWSGHGPDCDFSDSKWHCPWPLTLWGWGALVWGWAPPGKQERWPGIRLRGGGRWRGGVQDPWSSFWLGPLFGSGKDQGSMETRK